MISALLVSVGFFVLTVDGYVGIRVEKWNALFGGASEFLKMLEVT